MHAAVAALPVRWVQEPAALTAADLACLRPGPLVPLRVRVQVQVLVLALPRPPQQPRVQARQAGHALLRHALALHAGLAPAEVELSSQPGQPLRCVSAQDLALSVSHAPGLTLVALAQAGTIGLDVVAACAARFSASEQLALRRDYLGPDADADFARAWCDFEARLKCLGQPITEWQRELAACLAACQVLPLQLPGRWCGALAWRPSS